MKLYLTTIGVAMAIIAGVNIGFSTAAWYDIVGAVVLCTALQFALDGGLAILINKLPNAWFRVGHPLYRVSKWERSLYKKLGVKRWKDKVWELGGLGGFSKRALTDPSDPAYIERFIVECNKGVATHRLSYPIGFLVMLIVPGICAFTIALPVAVVNLYLNILPTVVLRHNTPLLESVLHRLRRKREAET